MVNRQILNLLPSETPLRKINSRSSCRETGFVVSRLRPNTCLDHESENEFAFIMRAELDPRVTDIYAQPLELTYRHGSSIRKAFPDFCITVDGIREWHEVKDDSAYAKADERERHWWIAREFDSRGHHYSITLRSQLRSEPETEHLEDVFRRFHTRVAPELWSRIDLALDGRPQPIGALFDKTARYGASFETFLALICSRRLTADIVRGVTEDTIVHPAGSIAFDRLIPFTSPLETRP